MTCTTSRTCEKTAEEPLAAKMRVSPSCKKAVKHVFIWRWLVDPSLLHHVIPEADSKAATLRERAERRNMHRAQCVSSYLGHRVLARA